MDGGMIRGSETAAKDIHAHNLQRGSATATADLERKTPKKQGNRQTIYDKLWAGLPRQDHACGDLGCTSHMPDPRGTVISPDPDDIYEEADHEEPVTMHT